MSQELPSFQNKHPKKDQKRFEQFLFNPNEPHEDGYVDSLARLDVELKENKYAMRQRFRQLAQRLRDKYS